MQRRERRERPVFEPDPEMLTSTTCPVCYDDRSDCSTCNGNGQVLLDARFARLHGLVVV